MNPVTILIPIGPQPEYLQWLPEAIESVLQQTVLPREILLIDDGSQLIDGAATSSLFYEHNIFQKLNI